METELLGIYRIKSRKGYIMKQRKFPKLLYMLAFSAMIAVAGLPQTAFAFGGGGGDSGGGSSGGDGDGNEGSVTQGDPPVAPVGFTKLKLIPWLAGDWQKDGAPESRTQSLVSRLGEIGKLLPYRGGDGDGSWNPATAPQWRDYFAIKWHKKPIVFYLPVLRRVYRCPGSTKCGPPPEVKPPPQVKRPPQVKPPPQVKRPPQSTGGDSLPGTTPALLRPPGPGRKPAPSLAEVEKMMDRAYKVLKRDQYLLEAQRHEEDAAFYTNVKKGLEYTQKTAEAVFTVAAIFAGGSPFILGLGTALGHGYMSYHEAKLKGVSTRAAMIAAAKKSTVEIAIGLIGSEAGKQLKAGARTAVSRLAVRDMAKNSVLGKKALAAAGKPVKVAIMRINLEVGTLEAVAGFKLNNIWAKFSATSGA